jgi:hypothetical protein
MIPNTLAVSPGASRGIFRLSEKVLRISDPTGEPDEELEFDEINEDIKTHNK